MTENRSASHTTVMAPPDRAASLPRYARPPVVEVAVSVQFDELSRFELVHFGLLWERVRARYPLVEHHPPLPSVVEFGGGGARHASLSIESGFPVGRCWYLSEDRQRVVQVQPDRFVVNWRKLETEAEYPSYDVLRSLFQEELEGFLLFLSDNDLGSVEPTQCELTYVNHVTDKQGWTGLGELQNVLSPWSGNTAEAYLPEVEDARFAWQYRFDEQGVSLGRLYVQAQSRFRASDRKPILFFQLTGRGTPTAGGVSGALAFLDVAHAWIVRGFTALTTDRMHKTWEREI